MDDRTGLLVIAGIALMLAGSLYLLLGLRPSRRLVKPDPASSDAAALAKQIGEFLSEFERRLHIGIAVMSAGLALVSAGLYIEVHSAKHELDEMQESGRLGAEP
jgi:hypothetical protein